MTNKFYDERYFQYAIDLLEKDPFHAKLRFEEYLKKYPKDYYARAYYVLLLTRICLFDEAEMEYEYIKLKSQNDHYYIDKTNDLKGFKHNMLIAKIKILAYHEQYQEILNLIKENYEDLNPTDTKYASYYCRIKLGKLTNENIDNHPYRFMQTLNYSEELFRNHIKKHLSGYTGDIEEQSSSIFNEDFPIDRIIDEVKKYIPSDKKIYPGYFDNIYFFKYDNCGYYSDTRTNFFTVVCFQNTSNIITMCPAIDCEKLPYVDLNYIKDLENDKIKVKKISQIEKFNRRFNRK